MPHAYFTVGDQETGVAHALAFAEGELGRGAQGDPDVALLRFGLLSVEDARRLSDVAHSAPVAGGRKVVIAAATRLFHESQNALLKLFEEPPRGVTLVLVLPAEGVLLPTLRSRLAELPGAGGSVRLSEIAQEFIDADDIGREKLVEKLHARSKSDKDEEKQRARSDAVRLAEGLITSLEPRYRTAKTAHERDETGKSLADLTSFLPLLHTRSAPLKLIFEHVRLAWPGR